MKLLEYIGRIDLERLFGGICILFLSTLVTLVILLTTANLIQPKVFKGYYLDHNSQESLIVINWDNRPDEIIFYSRDHKVTLDVLDRLNKGLSKF